jgi:virulence-associated protein VapD
MFEILNSTIGTGGPLIIEHKGQIICEHCMIIDTKHIKRMIEKIKDVKFTKIEQTSDRSFSIS